MKRIYDHIINIISSITDKYEGNISTQTYNESEPNQVGIILWGSRDDAICLSGELIWECLKLDLRVTCKDDETDKFENIAFLRKFVDMFENSLSTVDGLTIEWAKHLGPRAEPIYLNGYGLPESKCIIDFNYNLEEEVH